MNELQYRVNFVVQLCSPRSHSRSGCVLALVYSHTDELNGWSQSELLCVLGVQILMGGVIRMYIQPNMTRLIEDVREGKLDYALTKPEDAQVLVSVREVQHLAGRRRRSPASSSLAVGLSRSRPRSAFERSAFGPPSSSEAMIYCFWLVIATVAFWVVNMWHAVELFDGIFQTGRWPSGIYPGWLRYSVTFLVRSRSRSPCPPRRYSRLDWQTLALAAVFAVVLFAFTRWFWRFGLSRYTGASA